MILQKKIAFFQIKEQHRGDQMTPGPKSQLLSGIVVDTIPGPVSLLTIHLSAKYPEATRDQNPCVSVGEYLLMAGA